MATILDVGILNYFDFIFPWILVFALVFGLLQKTKFITDSIHINAADKAVYWPVLVIGIIIIIASFGTVFGQSLTEASLEGGIAIEEGQSTATGDFRTNIYAILFNTKVLGIMVLFTVAIFAVFLLSGT